MKYEDLDKVENSYGIFFTKKSVDKLLHSIIEDGCEVASECDGEPYCFFCGERTINDNHDDDCLYVDLKNSIA